MRISREGGTTLQEQVRRELLSQLLKGTWLVGDKLPSSRALAKQLRLSRNTVVLALQQMVDDGLLAAKDRSGLYVATDVVLASIIHDEVTFGRPANEPSSWDTLMTGKPAFDVAAPIERTGYRFVFHPASVDPDLFPLDAWREAARLSLVRSHIDSWSMLDGDDAQLVEQLRIHVLARRGIAARHDEILLTHGRGHGVDLLLRLLDAREAQIIVPFGDEALLSTLAASGIPCSLSGRLPCRGSMLMLSATSDTDEARREYLARYHGTRDFHIPVVEVEVEDEAEFFGHSPRALRATVDGHEVVYVASLPRILSRAVKLGYVVGPRQVIARLRHLRDRLAGAPAANNQRAAAQFLALGHYETAMRRLSRILSDRRAALRDALNHYFPLDVQIPPSLNRSFVEVRVSNGLDTQDIARAALARGVLIEARQGTAGAFDTLVMGICGIATDQIRAGVEALAEAFAEVKNRSLQGQLPDTLSDQELRERMAGVVLRYRTVYDDPIVIELHPDGTMTGRAGYDDEDCDTGQWWVDDGRYYRRWKQWSYGETRSYRVMIKGDRIEWWTDAGTLANRARISAA